MNFSSNENCQTAVLCRNSVGEFLFLDFIEVPYATRKFQIPRLKIDVGIQDQTGNDFQDFFRKRDLKNTTVKN
ncbi:hypothetical protein AYB33_03020 [Leptospira santarosai]|nr:hypothetical protein AYB33_03020 [Leptospira santarosai]